MAEKNNNSEAKNDESLNDSQPKKIEVDASTLEAVLKRQDEQDRTIANQKKEIEKLLQVSDKGRLARWDAMHASGDLIRRSSLAVWEDKIVLGWKMKEDKVWFEAGVLKEKQIITLFLENSGKKPIEVDVDYIYFYQNIKRQIGDVIKQSKGVGGVETFTIQLEDGRQFEVDVKFVNP